jgi:hypothetical protein
LVGLIAATLLLGYSTRFFTLSQPQASQTSEIKITVCDLFSGDLKRLEPLLDLGKTACLKFDYSETSFGKDAIELKLQE